MLTVKRSDFILEYFFLRVFQFRDPEGSGHLRYVVRRMLIYLWIRSYVCGTGSVFRKIVEIGSVQ